MRVALLVNEKIVALIEAETLEAAASLWPGAEAIDAADLSAAIGDARQPDGTFLAPAAPVVVPALSPRQIRRALASIGLSDADIEAELAGLPDAADALIDWRWATAFERDHPLVLALMASLGLPAAQVDALWAWAAKL